MPVSFESNFNRYRVAIRDRWKEDQAQWGSLLLPRADGVDERRLPTLAGAYPAFYRGVSQAIRAGTTMPVDPQSVIPVLRVLEELARQAG